MKSHDELMNDPEYVKHWNAVQKDLNALGNIPKKYLTDEICRWAVGVDVSTLQLLPSSVKTFDLYVYAINNDIRALSFLPSKYLSLIRATIGYDGRALQYTPNKMKTPELCAFAVESYTAFDESDDRVLKHVPKHYLQPDGIDAHLKDHIDFTAFRALHGNEDQLQILQDLSNSLPEEYREYTSQLVMILGAKKLIAQDPDEAVNDLTEFMKNTPFKKR